VYLYGLMYYVMRESKYLGGSKVATFRLPLEGFKSVRMRVQALLDEIAQEMDKEPQKRLNPMVASAEIKSTIKANNRVNNDVSYPCGCKMVGELFVRAPVCKMIRVIHGID
jgi:hypothetical protein